MRCPKCFGGVLELWQLFHVACVVGGVVIFAIGGNGGTFGVVYAEWDPKTRAVTERARVVPNSFSHLVFLIAAHVFSGYCSFAARSLDKDPQLEPLAANKKTPKPFWFDVRANQTRPSRSRNSYIGLDGLEARIEYNGQRVGDTIFVACSGYLLCFLSGDLDLTTALFQSFALGVFAQAYFRYWDERCLERCSESINSQTRRSADCLFASEPLALASGGLFVSAACAAVKASFAFSESGRPPPAVFWANVCALAVSHGALLVALVALARSENEALKTQKHAACHHVVMLFLKASVTAAVFILALELA